MELPSPLKFHAELIERRGKKHGHAPGGWHHAQVVMEDELPAELALRGVRQDSVRPRIVCVNCGAWAAFVSMDGISCNSPTFDQTCPGPPPDERDAA
jgi:hypothetical protein